MTELVRYRYDPKTGAFAGTLHGFWAIFPGDTIGASPGRALNAFDPQPNEILLTSYLFATMITDHPDRPRQAQYTQVQGGWAFVLGVNGKPTVDITGNYILVPPAWENIKPTSADYSVLGHIKSGALDSAVDIHPFYIVGLNRALNSIGAPLIKGTTLQPTPKRSCTSVSASLKYIPPAAIPAG